jgi:hypothetical protein
MYNYDTHISRSFKMVKSLTVEFSDIREIQHRGYFNGWKTETEEVLFQHKGSTITKIIIPLNDIKKETIKLSPW